MNTVFVTLNTLSHGKGVYHLFENCQHLPSYTNRFLEVDWYVAKKLQLEECKKCASRVMRTSMPTLVVHT